MFSNLIVVFYNLFLVIGFIVADNIKVVEKHDEYLKVGQKNVSYLLQWVDSSDIGLKITLCTVEIPNNGHFDFDDGRKSFSKVSYYGRLGGMNKGFCGATIKEIGIDYHGELNFRLARGDNSRNTNDLVHLNVAQTPSSITITQQPNDTYILLTCIAEELRPHINLNWYKNGQTNKSLHENESLKNKTVKNEEEDTLTIEQEIKILADTEVGNKYECSAEHDLFDEFKSNSIIIEGKPTNAEGRKKPIGDIEIQENSLIAKIVFRAYPKPTESKWYINDKNIENDIQLQELGNGRLKAELKKNSTNIADFENLQLIVTNSLGKTKYTFEKSSLPNGSGVGLIATIVICSTVLIISFLTAGVIGYIKISKKNKFDNAFKMIPMN